MVVLLTPLPPWAAGLEQRASTKRPGWPLSCQVLSSLGTTENSTSHSLDSCYPQTPELPSSPLKCSAHGSPQPEMAAGGNTQRSRINHGQFGGNEPRSLEHPMNKTLTPFKSSNPRITYQHFHTRPTYHRSDNHISSALEGLKPRKYFNHASAFQKKSYY